jgi:transposase
LLCFVAGVLAEADAGVWLRDALARALEANRRWEQCAGELRAENERLREENAALRAENARLRDEAARRDAELEQVKAGLAVLQRMVFGRSSEQARPDPASRGEGSGDGERGGPARRRGPGARAGRRDYSLICPGLRWLSPAVEDVHRAGVARR